MNSNGSVEGLLVGNVVGGTNCKTFAVQISKGFL